jgi:hypothetical protein
LTNKNNRDMIDFRWGTPVKKEKENKKVLDRQNEL